MFAIIDAREDGKNQVNLCFSTKEDAERFKTFTNTYMDESGARNGYGAAYWIFFNEEIVQCDKIIKNAKTELNPELVKNMLRDILMARTCDENHKINVDLVMGKRNGAIVFEVGALPPRQIPTKGDMFRALQSMRCGEKTENEINEGRVLEDLGGNLKVISCWDEDNDGTPKLGAKTAIIKNFTVMKINDWLLKHRLARKGK